MEGEGRVPGRVIMWKAIWYYRHAIVFSLMAVTASMVGFVLMTKGQDIGAVLVLAGMAASLWLLERLFYHDPT